MRSWLTILLVLPLFTTLQAQNRRLVKYEYWLDGDYTSRSTIPLTESEELIKMQIETREMTEGLHSVSLRVADETGAWSGTISSSYLVFRAGKHVETQLTSYVYWFDGEYEQRQTAEIQDGQVALQLDIASFTPGIHHLCYRILDSNGEASSTERTPFFVQPVPEIRDGEIRTCEYWFDEETGEKQSTSIQDGLVAMQLDVSSLTPGTHYLCYRVIDSYGNASSMQRDLFFVFPAQEVYGRKVTACEYWIDGDYTQSQEIAVTDERNIAFSLDAAGLQDGMHSISLRLKDNQGEYSSLQYETFYKYSADDKGGTPIMCEYWFDDDYANRKEEPVVDGNVIFRAETSEQTEGIHTLSWRIKDDRGVYSATQHSQYYKQLPIAPTDNIVWYQYWWNDRIDMAVRKEVSAEGEFNMEEIFEVPDYIAETNNQQMGKAEFHILFCNDKGKLSCITDEIIEDRIPPVSHMMPLPETQVTHEQVISWSGSDKWAGVKDYTLYVYSDADDSWHKYVENYSDTTITYYCSRYDYVAKFFVIARDSLDNVEPMKTEAEAQIRFMYKDIYPPTTKLHASEENIYNEGHVELTWDTVDDVNQIASNNIYYQEDDGPLILWKTVSGINAASFRGKAGTTYRFIVTGRDSEGNQEKPDLSKSVTVRFNY